MAVAALPFPIEGRQGFADEADRDRLARAGLRAFRRLAEAWHLTGQQASALLGVSTSTWERLKASDKAASLSQDQMTRISALVGVYKALHLLIADGAADRWPKLANSGPLFNRLTPVEAMIAGGIPVMLDVRRYVDAVRGGL